MDQDATKKIKRRLQSVEGHIRGIQRMVEKREYCIDVINQIYAVQQALQKVSGLILERHLHTCVLTAVRGEDYAERERVLSEIRALFEQTNKI